MFADLLLDGLGDAAGLVQSGAGDFQLFGIAVQERPGELLGAEVFVREALQAAGIGGGAQADSTKGSRTGQDAFAQQANGGIGRQAGEGIDAHGGVVVVFGIQARMQVGPVLLEQFADQCQDAGQAGDAFEGKGTLQKVVGDTQVFAALQQIQTLLLDAAPFRRGRRQY